jgi:phosphonate transport system permease protein
MAVAGRPWKKPPFVRSAPLRWALLAGVAIYVVLAVGSIEVNWERIYRGLERGAQFLEAFLQPDITSRWNEIMQGMYESVVMATASTIVGVLASIPIALGASRNVAILPVYLACRAIIAVSRALNELIVAIVLVAVLGFGPLAGFITLSFASVGFLAKLAAEEIEGINRAQTEAIKATGARWLQWINYGVQPQVMPRVIGISIYRLDKNFRESAVLGLVGAGGIGATLNTAFDRYEFNTVAAILLMIIAMVVGLEYLSGFLRKRIK